MDGMTAAELVLWKAYDAESPLSDQRGDIQAALVASSVFQAQGAKMSIADVLPRWGATSEPEPADWAGFLGALQKHGEKC